MDLFNTLSSLCNSAGLPGQQEILDVAESYLKEMGETTRDVNGSLVCTVGNGSHRVMLDAHIDEIGFLVTCIDGDFIRVAACGGIDRRTVIEQEVVVYGKEALFGVFAGLPPHLKKDEKKAPAVDDLLIDCGLQHDKLVELVSPGDRVGFRSPLVKMANDCVTSKSLDNRAGVAAIIMAASLVDTKAADCTLILSLSAQEELGCRGARTVAFAQEVDEAIVVDVSFGNGPDVSERECGKIGEGAMIGVSPVLNSVATNKLISLAKEKDIPYQLEVTGRSTGTNADVISITKSGIRTSLVSIPLRNMHTSCEVVSLKDIDSCARLIAEYVMNGGCR